MRVRFFMKGLLFAHEIVKMKEGDMVSDDNRLAKVPFSSMPLPVYYTTVPLGWIASQCHLCYNRECNVVSVLACNEDVRERRFH
jgi:hypothetical protein